MELYRKHGSKSCASESEKLTNSMSFLHFSMRSRLPVSPSLAEKHHIFCCKIGTTHTYMCILVRYVCVFLS
jgi:hypothetical protein